MNSSLLRLNTYWYMLITFSGCGMSLTLCMDKTVPDIINTFFYKIKINLLILKEYYFLHLHDISLHYEISLHFGSNIPYVMGA